MIILIPAAECFWGCYSNLVTVPKKEGRFWPILDLKALNHFCESAQVPHRIHLVDGDFLASIDIKDAYLHVPI